MIHASLYFPVVALKASFTVWQGVGPTPHSAPSLFASLWLFNPRVDEYLQHRS